MATHYPNGFVSAQLRVKAVGIFPSLCLLASLVRADRRECQPKIIHRNNYYTSAAGVGSAARLKPVSLHLGQQLSVQVPISTLSIQWLTITPLAGKILVNHHGSPYVPAQCATGLAKDKLYRSG
jgi:hypothetical protein